MFDAMMKLRSTSIKAYAKIVLRSTDKRPGKWPEDGYNESGQRDWQKTSYAFLFDKLDEEVAELKAAIEEHASVEDVLKEAADVSAVAMMLADAAGVFTSTRLKVPRVVCLCGSTKFKDAFEQANFRETMGGNIVLSVGFYHHSQTAYILRDSEKEHLDWLHKRKIDLADEIYVMNVGGYIGESTRSEILYALETGKAVRYLEPLPEIKEVPTPAFLQNIS